MTAMWFWGEYEDERGYLETHTIMRGKEKRRKNSSNREKWVKYTWQLSAEG